MSDEAAEVPFAERQAFRNGIEEGTRRGRHEMRAEIVAKLRAKADWIDRQGPNTAAGIYHEAADFVEKDCN